MSDENKDEVSETEVQTDLEISIEQAVGESIKADEEDAASEKEVETDDSGVDTKDVKPEDVEDEFPPEKGDDPKAKDDDSPKAKDDEDDDDGDDPGGDDSEITDELLERAVKAGMKMASARRFPDAEALQEALVIIEGVPEQSKDSAEIVDESSDIETALAKIPDLNPEEYDDDLVDAFKGLKDLVRQQDEKLNGLSKSKSNTWMEDQINTLGDSVAKTVRADPEKKNSLDEKFEVLKAGYQSMNKTISEEAIFQEAAQMTLSGELSKAKEQSKSNASRKRSSQRISRSSSKSAQANMSVEEETAAMLEEKFNKK